MEHRFQSKEKSDKKKEKEELKEEGAAQEDHVQGEGF